MEAFAILQFADQCLKYGNKFVAGCKSYLHAEEESMELLVTVESSWSKMETQIQIMRTIGPDLDRKLQDTQSRILSQLEGKLKTATLTINQLLKEKKDDAKDKKQLLIDESGGIRNMVQGFRGLKTSQKAKYVTKKSTLVRVIGELEAWQARYDPSWIMIMQMSLGNRQIDVELQKQEEKSEGSKIPMVLAAKKIRDAARSSQDTGGYSDSIWLDADTLDRAPSPIPYSSTHMAYLDFSGKEIVIVDTMISNHAANMNRTTREVRNMARILAEVDPSTFGLLKCKGVIKIPKTQAFASEQMSDFKILFTVPRNLSRPQSLRAILLSGVSYPLDERLDLAKRLTSSILFVHTMHFVHKNVRPETIMIFENEQSTIGALFLAGFEQFRLEDGITQRTGDGLWEHNLYRHPSRQGTHPEIDYEMQHDIYSLGVVLLEIGLWTSFVDYGSEGDKSDSTKPHAMLGAAASIVNDYRRRALENKKILEALAERELPPRLGKRYSDVVLLCLRCLDTAKDMGEDKKGFGVEVDRAEDKDGMVIGVRYIENVLEKIQEICI